MRILLLAAVVSIVCCTANAAEHVIGQKPSGFSVVTLKAKVGDAVVFKNDDVVFHNVFSLSDAQSFDLGAYGPGVAKKVMMEKTGKIDVECAVHPGRTMVIDVSR